MRVWPLWAEVLVFFGAMGAVLASVLVAACGIVSSRVSRSEERFTQADFERWAEMRSGK